MSFEVRQTGFEGPISLLVSSVLAHKVDLITIELSALVDEFVQVLAKHEPLNLSEATEFLLACSNLSQIKLKKLLGEEVEVVDDAEELSDVRAREILLLQLVGATIYRDVSREFQRRIKETQQTIARATGPDDEFIQEVTDPLAKVSVSDLWRTFSNIVKVVERELVDATHITFAPMPVMEVGRRVIGHLMDNTVTTFSQMVASANSRYEVVVSFLILLEAARAGIVMLESISIEDQEKESVQIILSYDDVETVRACFQQLVDAMDN